MAPPALPPSSRLARRLTILREAGILILLLVVAGAATALEPRFLSASNLRSVLLWMPLLAVVAMGQMMVIITRGIDLSVGSILALSGIVTGMCFRDIAGFNLAYGVLTAIGIGALLGGVNGGLIAWAGVPPIIMTLGTLSIYRGLVFIISGGRQVDNYALPVELIRWSQTGPFGWRNVPWVVLIAAAVAAVTWLFLRYAPRGRCIYALGSNPEAARLRGIPVRSTLFLVYLLTGILAGLAGLLYASRYGFVNPSSTGVGFELTVIAATVIGGTNIFGGSGNVPGVLLGCLLLGTINVALAVLGIAGTWQLFVYGLVILLAVVVDDLIRFKLGRTG